MEATPAPSQTQRRNWETVNKPHSPEDIVLPNSSAQKGVNSRLLETQESRKLASKVLKGRGRNVSTVITRKRMCMLHSAKPAVD